MSAGAVPDVVAPPPRHPRFPLIDGMRAIAVLSILVVHAVPAEEIDFAPAARLLAHLNIGVTVFFVISGFLLYRPFVAHRGEGRRRRRSCSTRSAACCASTRPIGWR